MSTISVLNTDASLTGKTISTVEGTETITGAKTFSRAPSAPFAVASGSAVVANLDADKLDGQDWSSPTITSPTINTPTINTATITSPAISTPTITGAVTLTGGQIAFPATQVPSSGVNTLDDYEEGSWTPVIGGDGGTTGQTYTTQVGRYVKIGKLVTVWCTVTLSAKGTITGNVIISGLPFTADSTANVLPTGTAVWISLATNWVYVFAIVINNTTTAAIRGIGAAGVTANTSLATADLNNTSQFIASFTYLASA